MGVSGADWEFVMLDIPTDDIIEEGENEDENKEEQQKDQVEDNLGVLDMPPSWYHLLFIFYSHYAL
jgi:hypothetical protein